MAKRKASTPSVSGSEITVAPRRNVRQKLVHDAPAQTTLATGNTYRTLDCVLIPRPDQALLDIATMPTSQHMAPQDRRPLENPEDQLPVYERPLILDGKRSRIATYKRYTISDFFHPASRHEEQAPQANSKPRAARKSTGNVTKGTSSRSQPPLPRTVFLTQDQLQLPLTTAKAPIVIEDSSEPTSRSSSRRPRRSAVRPSYIPEATEDSDEDHVVSAPATHRRGQAVRADAPGSDFENNTQDEGNHEDEFQSESESEAQSEESDSEEMSTDEGYNSGLRSKGKATAQSANARAKPKPNSSQAARGTSKTGKQTGKSTATGMLKLLSRDSSEPKGLNTGLPPLSSIGDIFIDITSKALSFGLREALETTNQPLRVATMCSGTESPLLALEMVQDSLRSLGAPALTVNHLFSAETVPYKQAYIERNFNPPIIFRDITELTSAVKETIPTATTVYGSKVSSPGNVDVLVAGTSCVDFSRLNKFRKDLDQEAGGESSETWFGVLSYVKAFRPAVVILENVLHGPWDRMMDYYREIGYEVGGVLLDTKNYYLPHTRQRGYLVCFDKSKSKDKSIAGAGKRWESLMAKFRRHASSPVAEFMLPDEIRTQQQMNLDDSSREYDWAACEIRHIQYRQKERLGNARPFTFWSESGTMNVPENGSISWYRKQPERVRDYMDVSFLRKAPVFDTRHKMRIWDVSQNVDMFSDSSQFGITSCITPSGLFFASDVSRALAPEELLFLQGLPLSKVSFTTETVAEIQNLAGNAMSTTAVGPAILAALICGQAVLRNNPTQAPTEDSPMMESSQLRLADPVINFVSSFIKLSELDIPDLIDRSFKLARHCFCEGSTGVAQKPVQQCLDCEHTTCIRCGGNPAHNYQIATSINWKQSTPVEFERYLRSHLPQCLSFDKISDLDVTAASPEDRAYLKACKAALQSTFTFARVKRTHRWTAFYHAPTARLELRLDGQTASWQLFALPDKTLPVNSEIRKHLEQPIAVVDCVDSLLNVAQWQMRMPTREKFQAQVEGAGQRIASWLARLGLPDYRNQQVWSRLHIEVPSAVESNVGHRLSGEYQALPHCGTASDSLYKRRGTLGDREIYLLQNPTRTGDPQRDSFIFTTEKERLDFGVERPVIASLDPIWSPWAEGKASGSTSLTPAGNWRIISTQLREVDPEAAVHAPSSIEASNLQLDCNEAELILKCNFVSKQRDVHNDHGVCDIDPKDHSFFARHAYILELMRRQLPATQWRPLPATQSSCACDSCAPPRPDEFHQYTPREYASLKALKADKRWGLSGTPAIADFYDIAQIADLLNIPLRVGSDSTRVMALRNQRTFRKEMTDFERFDMMREVPSDCMHARIHEVAQSFLDAFVRQNVMDFDAMTYDDKLVPVTLDADHQAVYTELSQQLASQEMNIRKAKKSKTTTRDMRFMAAIADVQTAEEALSRDSAFFERTGDLYHGLQHRIDARQSEIDTTLEDLRAACFAAHHELKEHNHALEQMSNTLLKERMLGDEETIGFVTGILQSTARPQSALPKVNNKPKRKSAAADDSDAEGEVAHKESKEEGKARELTAKANALAKGLLTSVRSKRYINNVHRIKESSQKNTKCDSAECSAARGSDAQDVAVSALCGHRVCKKCYTTSKQQHSTQCAATGCNASQQDHHLLWSHILGKAGKASPHGAKLEATIQLLNNIQAQGEKAILFVQYTEQLAQAEAALEDANIPFTVVASGTSAGEQIATFCSNNDTVLVLNASDETAAGSNIQAANHVIFLSPLLRDNQYSYDSTMAQAIGRVRRHGQTRPIHVYRICALHTIDVDILEHREHRTSALVEVGASDIQPTTSALELDQNDPPKKQRVQLVRENSSFSLGPRPWLYLCGVENDEQEMGKARGRDRVAGWEDFSSQVKFSRAFAGSD